MDNFTNDIGNAQDLHTPSDPSLVVFRSIALICLLTTSCCGNFLVFFTLYRRQYLLTPSNKLVFSLTFSNFIFSILILPFMIMSSIQQMWFSGKVWCSITGFVTLTILGASMFTLAMISFDRYYAVVHPLKYPSYVTSCRILCIIILCWLAAAFFSFPPLFGLWSNYQYSNAQMGCFWSLNRSFSVVWLIICLILPFCVMVISYTCIFRVAWTKTKQIYNVNFNKFSTTKLNTYFSDENEMHCRNEDKDEELNAWTTPSRKPSSIIAGSQSGAREYPCNVLSDSPTCSHAVDSGFGASSHDNTTAGYSINLPNQITDASQQPSPRVVFLNQSACLQKSSNNNNTNVHSESMLSNNQIMNPGQHMVSVHRNSSSADMQHLALPDAVSVNRRNNPNHRWRKSASFQDDAVPSQPLPSVSKHSSSGALHCPAQSNNPSPFPISRKLSRSSNTSRSSALSFTSNQSKLVAYSLADYYNNQKKALCTIFSVVGILFFCTCPFVVTSLYAAAHGDGTNSREYPSAVADWLISTVTILLLCTCVYHPLIYGLWNRSVRQEMRNVICGGSRGPATRRTRVLSLTSHIKDLSLSPRITAAIMLESAAVATIVRPMKLDQRSLKKHPIRVYGDLTSPAKRNQTNKSQDGDREETNRFPVKLNPKSPSNSSVSNHYFKKNEANDCNMSVDDKSQEQKTTWKSRSADNKHRDREQPVTSLLQINSSELLSSDLLLPTLLYTSPSLQFNKSASYSNKSDSNNDDNLPISSSTSPPAQPTPCSLSGQATYCPDSIAKLTSGRLWSSDLVHLEAGEPITIRKWNHEQTVDFFAQTFAYDLIESATEVDQ